MRHFASGSCGKPTSTPGVSTSVSDGVREGLGRATADASIDLFDLHWAFQIGNCSTLPQARSPVAVNGFGADKIHPAAINPASLIEKHI